MQVQKAVLKSFDSANYKATFQLAGSLSIWLDGVKVARNIDSAQMVTGRNCVLLFFDEANPNDGLVIGVYT